MSELKFKSGGRQTGVSVRWTEEGDDSKSVFLGDTVEGELTEIKHSVGPNESEIYVIKLDDGRIVSVWGTTVLDDAMVDPDTNETIAVGCIVRITCLGKKAGKSGPSKQPGKGYWDFEVQFAIPSPAFKSAKKQTEGKAAKAVTTPKEEADDSGATDEASDDEGYS